MGFVVERVARVPTSVLPCQFHSTNGPYSENGKKPEKFQRAFRFQKECNIAEEMLSKFLYVSRRLEKSGFFPRRVHVRFMLDKVAFEQTYF